MRVEQDNKKPAINFPGDLHLDKIQREYERIDQDWLFLHYKTSVGVVIFAFFVECIMGIILINSDLLTTTVDRYVWKFVIIPSVTNTLCIMANAAALKSKRLSRTQKSYIVSLIFVTICFVLFTAHNAFTATYFIFAGAIMLTTIYADYALTGIAALASICCVIFSELFVVWDFDKISVFESTLRMGDFLVSLFILLAFSIACMVVIRFERKKNEASIQMELERYQLQQSLKVDEMTGTFNRKALHYALKEIEDNTSGDGFILAIVDIDNFKSINDNWGHQLGDRCLIAFANILQENCGDSIVYRYGGDEFCLLFRNTDMSKAQSVCEQIRTALNNLHFEDNPLLKLTASFGLAAYVRRTDVVRLFMHADYALYQAKKMRNTISIFVPGTNNADQILV